MESKSINDIYGGSKKGAKGPAKVQKNRLMVLNTSSFDDDPYNNTN